MIVLKRPPPRRNAFRVETHSDCNIYIYKRASLACAGEHFVSARGVLWAPGVTLSNYKGNNISKYVCPTVIIDNARKIPKFINF